MPRDSDASSDDAVVAPASAHDADSPQAVLERSVAGGRVHSAYLISGLGPAPREAALGFVRALACEQADGRPCGSCPACRRSDPTRQPPPEIDGSGRKGPLLRHVGDHPDLLWIERGPDDTRVRIGQVRALQEALRLQVQEHGRRAAVVADAEWLNIEAQNALLRLLEEPPPATTLVLVATRARGLLATVRSRCQRIRFPVDAGPAADAETAAETARIGERIEGMVRAGVPELLDWAEEFRGQRARSAPAVEGLIDAGCRWLHQRATADPRRGRPGLRSELEAFKTLRACRQSLGQRNANPQMVAERALLALRDSVSS